ncbi:MAG: alpha/beta fold hydrolase [Xanthobacteraceae bacterium]|nr:alpha/beta fold hydrolase [Xanthobacteraceae bacterium]
MQFYFENHILDLNRRELRRGSNLIDLEPQVFDLLTYLMQNRDRVVSKDDLIASVWGGRIVSDSTLSTRINAARKAIGDSGEAQRLIRTMARKGFRFTGTVTEHVTSSATAASPAPAFPQQEVHFCTASDDVRIAYASAGRGVPLVKAANWLNHLEYDWHSPIWSPLLHALAAECHLIRYDERGNGLSDWDVDDISFEAFVRDLETVVDAAGLDKFSLFGISQGCAVSIAYTVRHPERVERLILHGGFARGRARRNPEQAETLESLIRQGWGSENPAFRQFFTSLFLPDGNPEQMQWFNDLQRITTSPANAVRIMQATGQVDVSDLLPQVRVPTLVLHGRNDAAIPFDESRRLAAGIPGARFVALETRNHLVLEGELAWSRLLEEITAFLKH